MMCNRGRPRDGKRARGGGVITGVAEGDEGSKQRGRAGGLEREGELSRASTLLSSFFFCPNSQAPSQACGLSLAPSRREVAPPPPPGGGAGNLGALSRMRALSRLLGVIAYHLLLIT